ncbi:MAG TPA: glycosyltransferase [Solirubrobacterales bacterium]|jgi:biofilm PGA synthesis N-glycosyltransferase PgaC
MPIVGFKSESPAQPRIQPPRLSPELPVIAASPDGIPHPQKPPEQRRRFYIPLRLKLLFVALVSLSWVGFSLWLAIPWIADLGQSITVPLAAALIAGIAIIPGYLNAHLISSLLFDKAPPLRFDLDFPAITLIVAAYNEAERIEETLRYASAQDYPGEFRIMVADDGSTDTTIERAAVAAEEDPRISVRRFEHGGKAHTLNRALAQVETPLVATLDADTLLMPEALKRCVARLLVSPETTVAVAGAVFVRNSRANLLTQAQEWDYFLGIASIKRQQGLFQGTLVAQGAFSVYDAEAVKEVGGWPDAIGEDIVLTWAMMDRGAGVTYEKTAVAFTDAPETARAFAKQRRRWARGMIEGLREFGPALLKGRRAYAHSILVDYVFPYVDLVYSIAFPVGIVLALAFQNYAIVGPLTLLVLPLNMILSGIMFKLSRDSFREVGLRVRRNVRGFFGYLLLYQLFMSPVSVVGYAQELFRTKRSW